MTPSQAKETLLLYRPGTADAEDPQVVAAVEVARRDPELARWFERHCAFQNAMRAKLRQIQVPVQLSAALLAEQKIVRPSIWWQRPVLLVPASMVLLLGLAGFWLTLDRPHAFTHFHDWTVKTASLQYRMDLVTNDMRQLRQFLASKGAHDDYELTPGLEKLQFTGGGCLQWRSHPIAIVCFNRGDNQRLFLFVMGRSALKDPPAETPQLSSTSELHTVSWTRGEHTYVLAGPEEPRSLRKYF